MYSFSNKFIPLSKAVDAAFLRKKNPSKNCWLFYSNLCIALPQVLGIPIYILTTAKQDKEHFVLHKTDYWMYFTINHWPDAFAGKHNRWPNRELNDDNFVWFFIVCLDLHPVSQYATNHRLTFLSDMHACIHLCFFV